MNLTDLPRPGIVSREHLALLPDQRQRLLESPNDEIVVHVVRLLDVGKCLEHPLLPLLPLLPPGEGIDVSEEVRRHQRRRRRLLHAAGNQEQRNSEAKGEETGHRLWRYRTSVLTPKPVPPFGQPGQSRSA